MGGVISAIKKAFEAVARALIAVVVAIGGALVTALVYPFSPSTADVIWNGTRKLVRCILGWCDEKTKKEEDEKARKREEAEKLNKQGEDALYRQNFEDALKLFKKAVETTDKDDPNLPKYKRNIERAKAAKANKEGNVLMIERNIEKAIEKFHEAIKILSPFSTYSNINDELNQFKRNLANAYNELGNKFYNNQEYEKAEENYQNAVNVSPPHSSRLNEYRKNVTRAQSAIKNRDAEIFNRQGWDAFNRGDYATAERKFQDALNRATQDYINRPQFVENRDRSKAEKLNAEGKKLFDAGNFIAARNKFQAAYDISPPAFKENFINNLNKAKAEVFNQEGLNYLSSGDFVNAIPKFNEAINILPSNEITRRAAIRDNLANAHNSYGEQLMSSNLHEALKHFDLAIANASKNNQNLAKFHENKKLVEWDIFYNEIKELLDDAEGTDKYAEQIQYYEDAIARLAQAMDLIPEARKNRLNELKNLKVRAHTGYGDALMTKTNYQNARDQFIKALEFEDDEGLKLKINDKITEAQLEFFKVEYDALVMEVDELSEEVAVESIVSLLEAYKATVDRTATDDLYKKLNDLIASLIERRSFITAEKAAEIGKKYFPDKPDVFNEILEEMKRQKEDQNHYKSKFGIIEDEKFIRTSQQVKYMSG